MPPHAEEEEEEERPTIQYPHSPARRKIFPITDYLKRNYYTLIYLRERLEREVQSCDKLLEQVQKVTNQPGPTADDLPWLKDTYKFLHHLEYLLEQISILQEDLDEELFILTYYRGRKELGPESLP